MSIFDIERILDTDCIRHIRISDSRLESLVGEAIVVYFTVVDTLPEIQRSISEYLGRIAKRDTCVTRDMKRSDLIVSIDADHLFDDIFSDRDILRCSPGWDMQSDQ